jgi:hypothetical protein
LKIRSIFRDNHATIKVTIIFFAVAGPTPGSESNSFSEAELISIWEAEVELPALAGG